VSFDRACPWGAEVLVKLVDVEERGRVAEALPEQEAHQLPVAHPVALGQIPVEHQVDVLLQNTRPHQLAARTTSGSPPVFRYSSSADTIRLSDAREYGTRSRRRNRRNVASWYGVGADGRLQS
jgi:hypothetical protein